MVGYPPSLPVCGFGCILRAGSQRRPVKKAVVLSILLITLLSVPLTRWSVPVCAAGEVAATAGADGKGLKEAPPAEDTAFHAPALRERDYPRYGRINSRIFIWLVAQLHLWFAAFILGVPVFVFIIEFAGVVKGDKRYDRLAHEFLRITTLAYSFAALLGGLFLFGLVVFYPNVFTYIAGLFGPVMLIYASLFFGESACLYVYYYGWKAMEKGGLKHLHLLVGFMLNLFGTAVMALANAVTAFMMAPSGVDYRGIFQGNMWEMVNSPLWGSLNLHRFIANIAYGGAVVAAYAAYRFLSAGGDEERGYYDWMGYTANIIAIAALLPLPFAGYWFVSEIYSYSQQLGMTLMGGIFGWMFIIQAVVIGILFLSANYYLWCGMARMGGAERYRGYVKYIAFVLVLCFLVWFTPHTIAMTPREVRAIGGSYHPYLGALGLMPAKNTAVNIMILFTFLSFMIYRRSNRRPTVSWAGWGNTVLAAFFLVGILNIILLGVGGYLVPANVKVGQSVPQVFSTVSIISFALVINGLMYRRAEPVGPVEWGRIPPRSQYALIVLAVSYTWLMGLMGYVRSAIRQHWHVYAVMRDNSPDAFTPDIGFAAGVVTIGTIIFLGGMIFIFWINHLSSKRM